MTTLWRELKKIFRQLLGLENIFGYQSTVANQLFLLYCFSGKIYTAGNVHHIVKYFWYGVLTGQIVFAYAMAMDYFWHSFKYNWVMVINVSNQFGALHLGSFGFPLLLYLYRDHIEAMIAEVDNTLAIKADPTGSKQKKIMADAKKCLGWFAVSFFSCVILSMAVNTLDIALFFEESKATDYLYYAIPPPLVQEYGSDFRWCVVGQCVTSVVSMFLMIQFALIFGLILYFCVICCNELTSLRSYLNDATCELNKRIEQGQRLTDWNTTFVRTLEYSVREFQRIIRWIAYLRGIVEVMGSIGIVCGFIYTVAQLYFCRLSDLSLALNVKFLMLCTASIISIILFYWIGQRLNNSISEVSLAVYSTPWYQSVEVRKNVYLLLCQTQSTKNFAIFKVYPLLYCNFARYLNGILSYTNILLRLTGK